MTAPAPSYGHATAVADILAGQRRFELAVYRHGLDGPEREDREDERFTRERDPAPERPN